MRQRLVGGLDEKSLAADAAANRVERGLSKLSLLVAEAATVGGHSEDTRAALEDVAAELVALAEVVRSARAGRLPSGVLRVVGEQARAREARRKGVRA